MLGNLVAKSDEARLCLFNEPGCMDVMLSVFRFYCDFKNKVQNINIFLSLHSIVRIRLN